MAILPRACQPGEAVVSHSLLASPGTDRSWGARLGKLHPLFHSRQALEIKAGKLHCTVPCLASPGSTNPGKLCPIFHDSPPHVWQTLWSQTFETVPPLPQLASSVPDSSQGARPRNLPPHLRLPQPDSTGLGRPQGERPGKLRLLLPWLASTGADRPREAMSGVLYRHVHGWPLQGWLGPGEPGQGSCTTLFLRWIPQGLPCPGLLGCGSCIPLFHDWPPLN